MAQTQLYGRIARLEALLAQQPNRIEMPMREVESPAIHPIGISRAISRAMQISLSSAGTLSVDNGVASYVDIGFWARLFGDSKHIRSDPKNDRDGLLMTDDILLGGEQPALEVQDIWQLVSDAERNAMLLDLLFGKIEPFIGILHEPTFRRESLSFIIRQSNRSAEFGALLAAVYALTVQILPGDTISSIFTGSTKVAVVAKFASAARAGLAAAEVLKSRNLATLQALLYWITFLYESSEPESASSVLGVANQIARRLGLHRNPACLGVTAFSAELRSRAWNHLQYLNTRPHVFEGMDVSAILEQSGSFYPANIHDDDWQHWLNTQPLTAAKTSNRRPKFPILRRQFATLTCFLLQRTSELTVAESDEIIALIQAQLQPSYFEFIDRSQVLQKFEALCVRLWLERLALSLDVAHLNAGRQGGNEFKSKMHQKAWSLLQLVSRADVAGEAFGWSWVFRADPEFMAASVAFHHIINSPETLTRENIDDGGKNIEEFSRRHHNEDFSLRGTIAWAIIDSQR